MMSGKRMNGMQRSELYDCGMIIRDRIAAVDCLNGMSDKFFRMGWGYDEPPVPLIEDDCNA